MNLKLIRYAQKLASAIVDVFGNDIWYLEQSNVNRQKKSVCGNLESEKRTLRSRSFSPIFLEPLELCWSIRAHALVCHLLSLKNKLTPRKSMIL